MKRKMNTREMILVSIFAALTAIGAFIRIPIPYVPFSLQFLFCAFSGIVLGGRLGALSQIIYVTLGLVGLPIFTQGGGLMYIFKPSFGYLIGFIVCSYVIGYIIERTEKLNFIKVLGTVLFGMIILYILGTVYFYFIMNFYLGKSMSIWYAIYWGALVFLGGDILLSIIISYISLKIIPITNKIKYKK